MKMAIYRSLALAAKLKWSFHLFYKRLIATNSHWDEVYDAWHGAHNLKAWSSLLSLWSSEFPRSFANNCRIRVRIRFVRYQSRGAGSRELRASDTFKLRWQGCDGARPEWPGPATSVQYRKNRHFRETFLASLNAFICHSYLSYTYNPW